MEPGKKNGGGGVREGRRFSNQTLPRNELCLRWSFQGLKVLEGFVLVQNNHKIPGARVLVRGLAKRGGV